MIDMCFAEIPRMGIPFIQFTEGFIYKTVHPVGCVKLMLKTQVGPTTYSQ